MIAPHTAKKIENFKPPVVLFAFSITWFIIVFQVGFLQLLEIMGLDKVLVGRPFKKENGELSELLVVSLADSSSDVAFFYNNLVA